jgi:hypothetical protein
MRQAIAAYLAVPQPAQHTAPPRADDQKVIAGIRALNECRSWLAAEYNQLDVQTRRDAAPSGVERGLEPVTRGFSPDPVKAGSSAARIDHIAARRAPCKHRQQWDVVAAGQVQRIPQRWKAAWRAASAND